MKRTLVWSMLFASCMATAVFVVTRQPVAGSARLEKGASSSESGLPFEGINNKARAAKTSDPSAIRALADEIFNPEGLGLLEIPTTAAEAMKERLIEAEKEYRDGKSNQKAIEERDVARMINHLADTLYLPDYARTSSLQVRHLRLGVWPYLPDFIAQEDPNESAKQNLSIGEKITSKMSPLEAGYLALLMLQQKASNVAFQVSPTEWPLLVHRIKLERWAAHRKGSPETEGPSRLKVQGDDNPKVKEIRQVASESLASLPLDRLESLPDDLLDTLGIQTRKEEK